MRTSKHSNHSTTGSATPTRYDNHSTVALGYRYAKSIGTWVSSLLTCQGHSLDLLAGFMTGI